PPEPRHGYLWPGVPRGIPARRGHAEPLRARAARADRAPPGGDDRVSRTTGMSAFRPPCDEAAIRASPASDACKGREAWVLAATILGSSMVFIDGTVVNVALPAIQAALHATLAEVQWVVEAYALL